MDDDSGRWSLLTLKVGRGLPTLISIHNKVFICMCIQTKMFNLK